MKKKKKRRTLQFFLTTVLALKLTYSDFQSCANVMESVNDKFYDKKSMSQICYRYVHALLLLLISKCNVKKREMH